MKYILMAFISALACAAPLPPSGKNAEPPFIGILRLLNVRIVGMWSRGTTFTC